MSTGKKEEKTSILSEYDEFIKQIENFEEVFKSFEYTGVNAKKVRDLFFKRGNDKGKSKKEVQKDAVVLLIALDTRGSRWGRKMENKMSKEGWNKLVSLKEAYALDLTTTGASNLKNDTITPARLGIAFPHIILRIRQERSDQGILTVVGERQANEEGAYTNFDILCFPGAAALIPTTMEKMFDRYVKWAISFDRVIHSQDQNFTSTDQIKRYCRIAQEGSYIPDSDRILLLQQAQVLVEK